jgi:hypothetical protein
LAIAIKLAYATTPITIPPIPTRAANPDVVAKKYKYPAARRDTTTINIAVAMAVSAVFTCSTQPKQYGKSQDLVVV